jgi:hypothetical protein
MLTFQIKNSYNKFLLQFEVEKFQIFCIFFLKTYI